MTAKADVTQRLLLAAALCPLSRHINGARIFDSPGYSVIIRWAQTVLRPKERRKQRVRRTAVDPTKAFNALLAENTQEYAADDVFRVRLRELVLVLQQLLNRVDLNDVLERALALLEQSKEIPIEPFCFDREAAKLFHLTLIGQLARAENHRGVLVTMRFCLRRSEQLLR